MGSTFSSAHIHYIFGTNHREPHLTDEIRTRLFPFIGGILRKEHCQVIAVGGPPDHVHILASLPPTTSMSNVMRLVKGRSSRWVHVTFPKCRSFAWQDVYRAFSVSMSSTMRAKEYIRNQQEHHRRRSFKEEFLAFLHMYRIPYDERYVWR